ncbi:MAG TPA: MATE family efflux transporter, partial [Thermoanaerobaculia bacterium]|nr:MATE family efflux transporter [Thermoanaerobaculia bacterium]
MLMGTVDTILLGHLSATALAAGALGHMVSITLLMLCTGVLWALDPLVAQAFGADDRPAISAHLQRGIVLAAALTVPITLAMWDTRPLLRLLGQQPEVLDQTGAYIRAISWGNLPYLLFGVFRQTLQAMSRVRPAMVGIIIGNLVNVVANYALIFGHFGSPALGVAGSAYASAAARWVMFLCLLLSGRRMLRPYWNGFTAAAVSLRHHARLLRLGLPIGLHNSLELCTFLTVSLLMGQMGIPELAGHQIAINLIALAFMIPLGISGAATTRVGNAIGRGDMPGARRSAVICLLVGAGVMTIFATLFATVPRLLSGFYTEDTATLAVAAALLPIAAVFQVFDGVQVVSAGVLRGAADTTVPAAIALLGFWLLGIPGGWYLAFREGLGPRGLWWGLTLGLSTVAVMFVTRIVFRFRSEIARELG